jgi:hypothetical protein
MRLLRAIFAEIGATFATSRPVSRFLCEGCDIHEECRLPARRRQMCQEARALLSR